MRKIDFYLITSVKKNYFKEESRKESLAVTSALAILFVPVCVLYKTRNHIEYYNTRANL